MPQYSTTRLAAPLIFVLLATLLPSLMPIDAREPAQNAAPASAPATATADDGATFPEPGSWMFDSGGMSYASWLGRAPRELLEDAKQFRQVLHIVSRQKSPKVISDEIAKSGNPDLWAKLPAAAQADFDWYVLNINARTPLLGFTLMDGRVSSLGFYVRDMDTIRYQDFLNEIRPQLAESKGLDVRGVQGTVGTVKCPSGVLGFTIARDAPDTTTSRPSRAKHFCAFVRVDCRRE
jgi:hypothetical protein